MNNKNKFRFWNPQAKAFVTNYKYNGYVDELFEPDEFLIPQQCIGILDSNMKEIYEDDVVRFKKGTKENIGIVRYFNSYCSYVVEVEEGYDLFADISFDSVEIVGNMIEDYMYDENGELVKKLALS